MAEYRIREYRDEDYEAARELFAAAMSEHAPGLCMHVLHQPWVLLVLACTFTLLLASSRSVLLPVLAVTLLLALGRQLLSYAWGLYIERCLGDDLRDIHASYVEPASSCFWVAEAAEGVVGTVAARPADAGNGTLMLRRMAVRRDFRGRGVATALGRAVLGFAQHRGCRAVVLNTLMVQHEARRLYEHLGFQPDRRYLLPTLYGRLAGCVITTYRYDLPAAD
ncbi:putative N-acetyltransferase camello [Alligator mississippiensis]|uniref:N-acetyltransferase camello n=2 Tax=Alligator mississippiensis TaxID=8496 RepID=A0A151PHQ0_ALLMI|nr:putative N-acetyltransferase camello [Alligator mississippiensis]